MLSFVVSKLGEKNNKTALTSLSKLSSVRLTEVHVENVNTSSTRAKGKIMDIQFPQLLFFKLLCHSFLFNKLEEIKGHAEKITANYFHSLVLSALSSDQFLCCIFNDDIC